MPPLAAGQMNTLVDIFKGSHPRVVAVVVVNQPPQHRLISIGGVVRLGHYPDVAVFEAQKNVPINLHINRSMALSIQ